ncbi:hypothetical protein CXB51_004786 [Gossypium anomalum]|uniref:Uncharacterized protein n=1 Tax=Gossypium anomalum TaxID=47600 RepID=A0A8J5ZHY0_9ROSI|nr:hypothetical protein CXB51_004786 [Gossypium anomalum]
MRLDHCGTWFYIHTIILSQSGYFQGTVGPCNYRIASCATILGRFVSLFSSTSFFFSSDIIKVISRDKCRDNKNRYKLHFLCLYRETKQGVVQAFLRSVIYFKRDPWPKVSDNAKELNIHGYKMPRKHHMFHWVRLKARLKQFSVMKKLKRALRVIIQIIVVVYLLLSCMDLYFLHLRQAEVGTVNMGGVMHGHMVVENVGSGGKRRDDQLAGIILGEPSQHSPIRQQQRKAARQPSRKLGFGGGAPYCGGAAPYCGGGAITGGA